MEFELRTSGADEYPKNLRMLVGGAPGVGKTRLALTAQNPLWVAARPGMTTLAGAGVPYVDVYEEGQLFTLKKALDNPPEIREEIFGRPINTLVVDTVDELQRRLLMGRLEKERRTEVKADDWNWIAQRMNRIFDGLGALDLDIIYLVHLKEVGGFDDPFIVKPNLQGGFVEQIHSHVDMSLLLHRTTIYTAPEPVEILEGEETDPVAVLPEAAEVESQAFLVTLGDYASEWVNDKTNTLDPYFDVNFEDDVQRIRDAVFDDTILEELPESTSVTVDDFAIEVAQGAEPEEDADPPEVKGMSSEERLKELLEKNKNKTSK